MFNEVQFRCRATELETRHTTDKTEVNFYHEAVFDFLIRCLSCTLGARGFSCAVSGVGHVSIVTSARNLWIRARFL